MLHHRLEKESAAWVESGWITADARQKILAGYQHDTPSLLIRLISVIGVLLLGVGLISFIAANWEAMPKLARLGVMLTFLWGSYLAAGWCLGKGNLPRTGEALLLLGVIAFGANIMLIAQIYHISAHFPDGLLLWAAGGILTAWLLHSQSSMVIAVALSLLWSGTEMLAFDQLHWQWLPAFTLMLTLSVRRKWFTAFTLLVIAFYFWMWMFLTVLIPLAGDSSAPVWIGLLAAIALTMTGRVLSSWIAEHRYGDILTSCSLIAAMLSGWLLSFPAILKAVATNSGIEWYTAIMLIAIITITAVDFKQLEPQQRSSLHTKFGLLFAAGFALMSIAFLISGKLNPIAFNLLFFLALVWLIIGAATERHASRLNLGFFIFAMWLTARYFDTFWDLLDRSLFFLIGGALFIAISIVLERKRRSLLAGMSHQEQAQ